MRTIHQQSNQFPQCIPPKFSTDLTFHFPLYIIILISKAEQNNCIYFKARTRGKSQMLMQKASTAESTETMKSSLLGTNFMQTSGRHSKLKRYCKMKTGVDSNQICYHLRFNTNFKNYFEIHKLLWFYNW